MFILDNDHEGILSIKLQHKYLDYILVPCVCYLPPENSSRHFDVNSFYDHLLTGVYQYQNIGSLYVCGDFNSRCGELDDFIVGVDHLPERDIIDFTTNRYGELFIDFLVNTNMCMLNGRSKEGNDFTSISTNGASVVDYCFTSHGNLCNIKDFSVILTSDMISAVDNIANIAPVGNPDLSLLSWNVVTNLANENKEGSCDVINTDSKHVKFDLNKVPVDFLNDQSILNDINILITKLESNEINTNYIDSVYQDWCKIVKENMLTSIPHKIIANKRYTSSSSRKHRIDKPWWGSFLTELWSKLCNAEKNGYIVLLEILKII